jgi:photosystem II stability/assembly factor-like uncharacterized protein
MTNLFTLITLFTFITLSSYSQKLPSVKVIQDSIKSSFRGLSVPTDSVIWVSGSNGTVGRSTDAGNTWKWMIVPGFEKRDFRDIEAFDSETAIIMAVDNPGNILKTKDGGNSWKVVFEKEQEGMFLDAMGFKGGNGICIGDPVINKGSNEKQFYLISTKDHGETWVEEASTAPKSSEAVFAASGTNIIYSDDLRSFRFITGGIESSIVNSSRHAAVFSPIPIMKGKPSTGAFSMTIDKNGIVYITGGDYNEYWKDSGNVVYTSNSGKTWKRSSVNGYRSCIIQTAKKTFITCGTNGIDISFNGCKTWKLIHGDGAKGKDGFNVCAKSKTGKAVYFAGTGRIGKLLP